MKPEVINSGNGLPLEIFDGTYSVYGSFGFSNGNMKPGSGRKLKFPDKKIKNKELGAFAFFVAALAFRESEPMVRFVRNIRTADPRQVFLTVSYFQKHCMIFCVTAHFSYLMHNFTVQFCKKKSAHVETNSENQWFSWV